MVTLLMLPCIRCFKGSVFNVELLSHLLHAKIYPHPALCMYEHGNSVAALCIRHQFQYKATEHK